MVYRIPQRAALVTVLQHMCFCLLQVIVFQGPLVAMEVDYINVLPGQSQVRHCRTHYTTCMTPLMAHFVQSAGGTAYSVDFAVYSS